MVLKILTVIVGVVIAGLIGFSILDSITTNAIYYTWKTNESHVKTSGIGVTQNTTLACYPVTSGSVTVKNTSGYLIGVTNYSVFYPTGVFNYSTYWNNTDIGTTSYITYSCEGPEYFDSSLSRTIVAYVVPIGLLGILAAAAFLSM